MMMKLSVAFALFMAHGLFAAVRAAEPLFRDQAESDPTALVIRNKWPIGRNDPPFTDELFLEKLRERRDWTRVESWGTPRLTGAILEPLAELPDLRVLKLSTSDIDDAGLETIAKMPALKVFEIAPSGAGLAATNTGIAALGRSSSLEEVTLRIKLLDDFGLAGIAAAPRLRRLALLNPDNFMHIYHRDRPHEWVAEYGVSRVTRAGLEALTQSRMLTHLRLESANITDEDAAVVARIPNLKSLEWAADAGTVRTRLRFGDDFFRALAQAPNLEELRLSNFLLQVGPEGVKALAERGRLTRLNLGILRLPPDQHDFMLGLIGRFPNMEHLDLYQSSPAYSDEGFRQLAPLVKMASFRCAAPKITEEALQVMNDWNRLESLHLDASLINDALLWWAAGRPALRHLSNRYAINVTDAGLDALGPDCALVSLSLGGQFSRESVDALKARLPRLKAELRVSRAAPAAENQGKPSDG